MSIESRKVCLLTSPNQKCGVREYGEFLIEALEALGCTVTEGPVDDSDLVIVNYQDSVQPLVVFNEYLDAGRDTIIIFHDLCINQGLHLANARVRVTHARNVYRAIPQCLFYPMPIPYRQLRIGSFGLGRNEHDLITEACEEAGADYSILRGDQEWVHRSDLRAFIRNQDIIVFWYPECSAAGTSFGVRLALSEGVKVITNNTEWFNDVPEGVTKAGRTRASLIELLQSIQAKRRRDSFVGMVEMCLKSIEDNR